MVGIHVPHFVSIRLDPMEALFPDLPSLVGEYLYARCPNCRFMCGVGEMLPKDCRFAIQTNCCLSSTFGPLSPQVLPDPSSALFDLCMECFIEEVAISYAYVFKESTYFEIVLRFDIIPVWKDAWDNLHSHFYRIGDFEADSCTRTKRGRFELSISYARRQ